MSELNEKCFNPFMNDEKDRIKNEYINNYGPDYWLNNIKENYNVVKKNKRYNIKHK